MWLYIPNILIKLVIGTSQWAWMWLSVDAIISAGTQVLVSNLSVVLQKYDMTRMIQLDTLDNQTSQVQTMITILILFARAK
jgi:hypothetical protein